jgi:hypothetical protein
MATSRQTAANRANARKATGPKTPAGKAVASRNATRHAILQGSLLATKGEDAAALAALRDALAAELAPAGPLEAALVERMVGALWRLWRVQAAEVGMFDIGRDFDTYATSDAEYAGRAFATSRDTFAVLSRYEVALERSLFGALHELQRLQAARAGVDVPAPLAVDVELNGLPACVG